MARSSFRGKQKGPAEAEPSSWRVSPGHLRLTLPKQAAQVPGFYRVPRAYTTSSEARPQAFF